MNLKEALNNLNLLKGTAKEKMRNINNILNDSRLPEDARKEFKGMVGEAVTALSSGNVEALEKIKAKAELIAKQNKK